MLKFPVAGSLSCSECGKTWSTRELLSAHICDDHLGGYAPFEGDICLSNAPRFSSRIKHNAHISKHHNMSDYEPNMFVDREAETKLAELLRRSSNVAVCVATQSSIPGAAPVSAQCAKCAGFAIGDEEQARHVELHLDRRGFTNIKRSGRLFINERKNCFGDVNQSHSMSKSLQDSTHFAPLTAHELPPSPIAPVDSAVISWSPTSDDGRSSASLSHQSLDAAVEIEQIHSNTPSETNFVAIDDLMCTVVADRDAGLDSISQDNEIVTVIAGVEDDDDVLWEEGECPRPMPAQKRKKKGKRSHRRRSTETAPSVVAPAGSSTSLQVRAINEPISRSGPTQLVKDSISRANGEANSPTAEGTETLPDGTVAKKAKKTSSLAPWKKICKMCGKQLNSPKFYALEKHAKRHLTKFVCGILECQFGADKIESVRAHCEQQRHDFGAVIDRALERAAVLSEIKPKCFDSANKQQSKRISNKSSENLLSKSIGEKDAIDIIFDGDASAKSDGVQNQASKTTKKSRESPSNCRKCGALIVVKKQDEHALTHPQVCGVQGCLFRGMDQSELEAHCTQMQHDMALAVNREQKRIHELQVVKAKCFGQACMQCPCITVYNTVYNTVFYFADDPHAIEEHLTKEHFASLKCSICPEVFFLEDKEVARDHIQRRHGGQGRVEMRSLTDPDYLTTNTDCFPYL